MTRLPSETWDVVALPEEPAYELNEICAAPGCNRPATENHHIWARSFTKRPEAYWVELIEAGFERKRVPGRVGLCNVHHADITGGIGGHRAMIVYYGGKFYWVDQIAMGVAVNTSHAELVKFSRPLDPQPGPQPMQLTVEGEEVPHDHVVASNGQTTKCPRCKGQGTVVKPEPKPEGEKKEERPKVTWAVRVPKDEREDGYELLEERMVIAVEKLFDAGLIRDKNKGANYYALCFALDFFNQDFDPSTMEEGA